MPAKTANSISGLKPLTRRAYKRTFSTSLVIKISVILGSIAQVCDGKDTKPTDYKGLETDPTYPVFDENGEQYYETVVVGVQVIEGAKCYKVKVTPKQATTRHFSGHIYYKTDDLEPHVAEGTIGKLPWLFTKLYMRFYFVNQNGYPMFRSGVMTIKVNVPVVFADHTFDTTIDVIESKPIPY